MSGSPQVSHGTQIDLADQLLAAGRPGDARAIIEQIMSLQPRNPDARRLSGLVMQVLGDLAGAEAAFKVGLRHDPGHARLAITFADMLDATGRTTESERILRTALNANRRSDLLALSLARNLVARGRSQEALHLTSRFTMAARPDHALLSEHAMALKASCRQEDALATYERAATLYPDSAVAHHNLAAALGDMGRFAESERTAGLALRKDGKPPQTWLVYARALLGIGKLDEADRAFREALRRDPAYADAHRDLAQLVWMRTEDPRAATEALDAALAASPRHHALWAIRANLLQHAGQPGAAAETLARALHLNPGQASLHLSASQIAAQGGRAAEALLHARQAATLLPGDDTTQSALFAACVAAGELAQASAIAETLLARRPLDQRALAYQALAWRLMGDPRYAALHDYAAFVGAYRMDVPDGWPDLPAYLADLARTLAGLHPFRTHPLDQSLRHGSQATHLLASPDPVIRAFFQSVDGPIRRHLAALGHGEDPLRRRNRGRYRYHGAWSVRLRPGGYHTDHIHPEGWLSSACYIALPEMAGIGQEAWIKFGQPGIPTQPPLGPEHLVRPEPGLLVLFPSYMWHGTVPFSSGGNRLSIAFDLVPE